jgi:hypothetical protein
MKQIGILIPLVFVGGCGQGGPSYMPLVDEKSWLYTETSSSSLQRNVPEIKVGKKISVGGVEGRVLTGDLGESRLAWNKHQLVASMLANTTFNPPITLLVEDKIPSRKKGHEDEYVRAFDWAGHFESLGKTRGAKAILTQRRTFLQLNSGESEVVETVLKVQIEGAKDDVPLEVRTWFQRGVGIVKQEQRTNRNFIIGIDKIGK